MAIETTRRRRLRLSLRALLLVIAAFGIGFGWFANKIYWQRKTIAVIKANGGVIYYDWQKLPNAKREPPVPRWLRWVIGDELFQEIAEVYLRVDELPTLKSPPEEVLEEVFEWIVRGAPRITSLEVHGYSLSEGAYTTISKLGSLEHLSIFEEDLTDAKVSGVAKLTRLKNLDIGLCDHLTDRAFDSLSRLRSLETLVIDGWSPTDRGLEHLSRFPKLKYLILGAERSDVSAAGVRRLGTSRSLGFLKFVAGKWKISNGDFGDPSTPAEAIEKAISASGER